MVLNASIPPWSFQLFKCVHRCRSAVFLVGQQTKACCCIPLLVGTECKTERTDTLSGLLEFSRNGASNFQHLPILKFSPQGRYFVKQNEIWRVFEESRYSTGRASIRLLQAHEKVHRGNTGARLNHLTVLGTVEGFRYPIDIRTLWNYDSTVRFQSVGNLTKPERTFFEALEQEIIKAREHFSLKFSSMKETLNDCVRRLRNKFSNNLIAACPRNPLRLSWIPSPSKLRISTSIAVKNRPCSSKF
jgi:hypothetical protein